MELYSVSSDTDSSTFDDDDLDRLHILIKRKSECDVLERIFPNEDESEEETSSISTYNENDSNLLQDFEITEKIFPSAEDTTESERVCASISSIESSDLSDYVEELFRTRTENEIIDILNEAYESDNDSSDEESTKEKEGDVQNEDTLRWNLAYCKTFAGLPIESVHDGDKIKVGQRVVRGKDWSRGDQDGGEGNVGTVVRIISQGKVEVQWDSRDELYLYSTGEGRRYDLRLYDNAQTGAQHRRSTCHMCNEFPIRGMKWRCRECEDYNLCSRCYMENEHDQKHIFERRQDNASMNVEIGSRVGLQYIPAYGVFPYQSVRYRENLKKKGKVLRFDEENVRFFNCDAKVKWEDDTVSRYPVGREGKSELVCKECPNGVYYYEDHLPGISEENAKIGLRVVRVTTEEQSEVGTIVSIQSADLKGQHSSEISTEKDTIYVKWDFQEGETLHKFTELKLFDNSQIGITHLTVCEFCQKGLLKGIRWHCTECDNYDLCTFCYMSKHDDMQHHYARIVEQNQEAEIMPAREYSGPKKKAEGIFKGSTVYDPKRKDGAVGEVKTICSHRINIARNTVIIEGQKREKIRNLKSEPKQKPTYYYFPEHLPDLGNDTCGYIKTTHNGKKITVKFWFLNRNVPSVRDERPRLYLIFAIVYDNNDSVIKKIKEIRKISKEHKTPCHLVTEKILIFEDIVVVHKNTTDEIIKLLLDIDGFNLNRGDIDADEGEIMYFKRMAEYCCGDLCLPVIISLRNGKMIENVRKAAEDQRIPVISFKRESVDAVVITFEKDKSSTESKCLREIEHIFDVKTPWARKRQEETNAEIKKRERDEIQKLQELQYLSTLSFDALVCYLLIGVSMAESEKNLFGKYSTIYPNALSMYLLKEGKWKIPKDIIKKYFSHRSIEYILEEKMDDEFKAGLWQDLSIKSNKAFQPPTWKTKGKQNAGFSVEDFDEDEDFPQDYPLGELDVRTSELYGLIFYALLRKNFDEGAKQLIETGGVRIRHILIGCVILKETEENWRTTQLEKEKMLELQKIFSHQALRIISCMHEIDNPSVIKKRQGDIKKTDEELGEQIQHAGRLLLNHGCLTDAIKTKNKIFLGNNTVKDILNQMWYGKKTLSIRRRFLFLLLTLLHVLLLPLLMINMEHKPLRWLYKQYKIPVMKVLLNLVGLLALLTGYAYMLLFDFKENGISFSDYFIIAWMVSFFIDETKQMLIAFFRGKLGSYASEKWNILDWMSIGTYLSGMLLRIGDSLIYYKASRILLVLAFIMLCIRVLNLFCISELLGPKLVIIQKMFLDTFGFMAIMTVITICYNVSYYTILYSDNSDFSFEQIEKVARNGYWMLFGELNLETDRLKEPDCTFNKSIYMSGALERCPSDLGRFLAPYLKAVYGLVAVILMLNLLIAMYSHTFSKVQEKSELYWTQLQTNFLEEYSVKSIFPIHMQLPAFLVFIIQFIVWLCFHFLLRSIKKCCMENTNEDTESKKSSTEDSAEVKLNHTPMFVRVFLYDSNFDLELTRTRKAEGYAALRVKGEMTFAEKDKLTVLQDEISMLEKSLTEKNEKLLDEKIRKIESKIDGIRYLLFDMMKNKTQEHRSQEAENNIILRCPPEFEDTIDGTIEAENNITPRQPPKLVKTDNFQDFKARRSLKFEETKL